MNDLFSIYIGASPFIPKIEGIDTVPYITSTEALRLTEKPKSICVIGGGYIGCGKHKAIHHDKDDNIGIVLSRR